MIYLLNVHVEKLDTNKARPAPVPLISFRAIFGPNPFPLFYTILELFQIFQHEFLKLARVHYSTTVL